MNVSEYMALDGVGLAQLIARGEISAGEAAQAALEVIDARNPELNAIIMRHPNPVPSAGVGSALGGVPFLLKDANLYSADMPTTFGSAYFRNAPPPGDSIMVARWRNAGLTILGKTNTPEFAAEFITEPRAYGVTRNPRDLRVTVGGSSGGAASAVAAGMVPLAHATDLGGSIRIPASCCGVFGFKPSAGLNPLGPFSSEIASGLNSDHVVTRSVRDSAASLDITADRKPESGSYLDGLARPPKRLRVGVCTNSPSGESSGPEQQQAVQAAASALEQLGHRIVEYSYPSGLSANWFDYLWVIDIVKLVDDRTRDTGRAPEHDQLEELTWHLLEKVRIGGRAAYDTALAGKAAYAARYLASMQNIDVLLTPTLAGNPPQVGELAFTSFKSVDDWNEAGYGFAPFSIPSNISGQPSASCPFFKTASGSSVGVQLSGKPGDDLQILQLCAELESASS